MKHPQCNTHPVAVMTVTVQRTRAENAAGAEVFTQTSDVEGTWWSKQVVFLNLFFFDIFRLEFGASIFFIATYHWSPVLL
jgi:hypothetical protein